MQPNYPTDMNIQNRKRLWWILFIALLALVGGLFLVSKYSHKSPPFPQSDQVHSTTFEGMSSFVKQGLTTDQVDGLVKAFSKFSPSAANTSIDTASLATGARDPDKIEPFTVKFNVSIDSTQYTGLVSYSDMSSVRLFLYDPHGTQVFDSKIISPPN